MSKLEVDYDYEILFRDKKIAELRAKIEEEKKSIAKLEEATIQIHEKYKNLPRFLNFVKDQYYPYLQSPWRENHPIEYMEACVYRKYLNLLLPDLQLWILKYIDWLLGKSKSKIEPKPRVEYQDD